MSKKLVDLILKGDLAKLDFSFLQSFLKDSQGIRDHTGHTLPPRYDQVKKLLQEEAYLDLYILSERFPIVNQEVPKVFCNLGKDGKRIELLLFLDVMDLQGKNETDRLADLAIWSKHFGKNYGFDSLICHPNADEENLLFHSFWG